MLNRDVEKLCDGRGHDCADRLAAWVSSGTRTAWLVAIARLNWID